MPESYPLEEVFLAMRRRGAPLGWRDYQDALTAMAGGFGGGRREDLLRVLQVLWARTDGERRMVEQVLALVAPPAADEIAKYTRPAESEQTPGGRTGEQPAISSGAATQPVGGERPVTLEFGETGGGVRGIPRPVFPRIETEAFVLTPQPPLTVRGLTVAWRRFQKRVREGPRVELDVEGSVAEQCRTGYLPAPVLRPLRRNQARLVLLIDVSPSMAAWNNLLPAWEESIAQGQLGAAAVYYFSNLPEGTLYRHRGLREPVELNTALNEHRGSALLVYSDGGAARGRRDRRRMKETREFLRETGMQWDPAVWLNPLPEARWKGSTAEWLAREPRLAMLPMNEAALTRAIDILRGAKAAA
jgi:uncharacterized protein with von Willebrand factor type A (vWA) domain